MDQITVNARQISKTVPNFWNNIHFHPTDAVEDEWGRKILDQMAADGIAHFVRLYTMLEDIVFRNTNGELFFCWDDLNHRLDYMLKKKFRLLLCFNFMPPCMAEDPASVSWLRYKNKRFNSAPPADYREWEYVCKTLTSHLLNRYGTEQVRSWSFQCWNEPDQIYWLGGERYTKKGIDIDECRAMEYCKLYDYFEAGVHRADVRIETGGPSIALNDRFLHLFLQHCTEGINHVTGRKGTRIDFVSVHAYSEFHYEGQLNRNEISPDNISTRLNSLHCILKENNCEALPMLMDEWGGATMGFRGVAESPTMIFRETEYFASFYACLIDQLSESTHLNMRQMMLCLSGQDYQKHDFDGCRTLFTQSGFPKPIYNSFRLAAKLGEQRLSCTTEIHGDKVGVIPSKREDGTLAIMLYHHIDDMESKPQDWFCHLTIEGLSGKYYLRRYLIDQTHANCYSQWCSLHSPDNPTIAERVKIMEAGTLEPLHGNEILLCYGSWNDDFILKQNSVMLLELELVQSEQSYD